MNIALVGASGAMGATIVDELLRRGHSVTGICRNPGAIAQRDRISTIGCDAANAEGVRNALRGHDAVVLAVRYLGLDVRSMLQGIRDSGVSRVIMVGHSGTLYDIDNRQLVDTAAVTAFFKPEALDAREAFKLLRRAHELAWTYAAPAALLTPGKRTEEFRIGGDRIIRDRLGESRISMEDFAIAIVDELEEPQHIQGRFTAAY